MLTEDTGARHLLTGWLAGQLEDAGPGGFGSHAMRAVDNPLERSSGLWRAACGNCCHQPGVPRFGINSPAVVAHAIWGPTPYLKDQL